ncbi:MAG TPA: glycogen/starch/alpha-glucan phosphorylase [Candidatus Macondimonas sp.]|nr:glycogen/starch/alpha-glucan phosphorylase [Candidatus Macondimonas sp.]
MSRPQLNTFPEDERTGLDKEVIKRAFLDHLFFSQGKFPALATMNDYYLALAYTIRDRLLHRWISTAAAYTERGARTVCYLSAEFLLGTHLGNNLINLGIYDEAREAVEELGLDFLELLRQEEEPGLGNGGLGRLAACFLDSMATLEIPSLGYGIRYEFGIFDQDIVDGWQVEKTDKWLRFGNPWEIQRAEWAVEVMLGGHTEHYLDEHNHARVRWVPHRVVKAVPYDTPILGYRNCTANTLRLWRAEAPESFDFGVFNRGDYYGAVDHKISSENITKVLYPNDEAIEGKALRLEQQFFLVSASLQDMFRILDRQHIPVERFHEKFAAQMNDTHPALAVCELMRLLVDERHLPWETAWDITQKTLAYTNHTLLPEALEQWPLALFSRLLPRHLEIIYEINDRFLEQVRVRYLGDPDRVGRLSLINESGHRAVRMAHLACVGSHAINGVAALHSELLKQTVLKDFYELWPNKFSNKTNGVTPRRWMFLSNPRLTRLITEAIGPTWTTDLTHLSELAPLAEDSAFRQRWQAVKQANKADLARFVGHRFGEQLDPETLFDVQVKRIHEYKRQHLNALHIIATYLRLKNNPGRDFVPRTYLFGGKAAPGYHMAKLIIKLINSVGGIVNNDPEVAGRLKIFFVPNFHVSNGQRIYPAADLSEQISTAGKEASGTGNMKFTLNGALTIGTLDGANVEIRERVGEENFFLFGHTEDQITGLRQAGYRPMDFYHGNEELKAVVDLIASGYFSRGDKRLFQPLIDDLLHHDPFFVLADFAAYLSCQDRVDTAYRDRDAWNRMAILNTAHAGFFSSDRSIREYQREIWKIPSVPITLIDPDQITVTVMQ